jgi:hypothetical protein
MKRVLSHAAIVVAVASSFAPRTALAEPTQADRVAARDLFEDARVAMKSLDYQTACPKLEQSQRLDPGIGTLYNLGRCYEGQGRLARAWATFLDVAEEARRAGQGDREAAARARATALEPRLPHLRVTVAGPDHPTLTLDGAPFADASLDASVPVDPGGHDLGADAPGKKHWTTHVDVSEAGAAEVSVPLLAEEPAALPPPAEPKVTTPSEPAGPATSRPSWRVSAAFVTGGLGVIGLGIGTAFGFTAMSDWSTAKPGCPQNNCTTPTAAASWRSAHSAGIASTASFIVGGALLATGAVIWLTRPSAPARVGLRSDGAIVVGGRFP